MYDRLSKLIIATLFCCLSVSGYGQDLACSDAVSVAGPVIEVTAITGDDTANIQCALDEAAELGYREVLLTSAQYEIGAISVDRFIGDFKGKSSDITELAARNQGVSCNQSDANAVLKFRGGSPSVKNMAIIVDRPCQETGAVSVITFSGESDNCDKRTVFGTVDRVVITGTGLSSADTVTAITADTSPECDFSNQQINGSLIVNRVTFSDLDFGVISSLGNSSPVDITFNTFSRIGLPITVVDARQATKIFRNTFNYNDVNGYSNGLGTTAVFVANTALSPIRNSTLIQDNTFNDFGANDAAFGVLSGQSGQEVAHSFSVIDNRFFGSGFPADATGIAVLDTTGGIVANNRFKDGDLWIYLGLGDLQREVTGWAIVGNDFSRSKAAPDIRLDFGTSGNVVGAGQNLGVVDDTTGLNDILLDSVMAQSMRPRNLGSQPNPAARQTVDLLITAFDLGK